MNRPSATDRTLLLIARDFPPAGGAPSLRVTKLVKYLPEFGWRTVILTTPEDHAWATDETLMHEVPVESQVVRVRRLFTRTIPPRRTIEQAKPELRAGRLQGLVGSLLVPDRSMLWAVPTAVRVPRIASGVDAVMTTAPPFSTHLIGLRAKAAGLPWLADYRDNWTTNPDYVGRGPTGLLNRLLERVVLRSADAISVVSDVAARELESIEPTIRRRLVVAPNGFDHDDLPSPAPSDGRFRMTYTGSLRATRDPRPLLRVLQRLLESSTDFRNDLELNLVGQVPASVAADAVNALGADRVRVSGFVAHRGALLVASRSAVLIAISSQAEAGAAALTSKLIEYLAMRRPVLYIAPSGPGAELVTSLEAGEAVDPEAEDQLEQAVIRLYNDWRNGVERVAAPTKLAPYTRRETARIVATALDTVVFRRRASPDRTKHDANVLTGDEQQFSQRGAVHPPE